MPRRDGIVPSGQGRVGSRGQGRGIGRGRMGGRRPGAGPSGNCICFNCGARVSHQPRVSCNTVRCPKCGAEMVRE